MLGRKKNVRSLICAGAAISVTNFDFALSIGLCAWEGGREGGGGGKSGEKSCQPSKGGSNLMPCVPEASVTLLILL